MNTFVISNVVVYSEKDTYKSGYIKIINGKIAEVGPASQYKPDNCTKVIELSPDYQVIPGAIDIHIHGAANADAMDATFDALVSISEKLPREGTTSFLATTMTQSLKAIEAALLNAGMYIDNQAPDHAEIVGIHLEGPFISKAKKGAQPEEYIIDPHISLFKKWQEIAKNQIKLVTLAPEQPNGLELTTHLKETGVVASIGHSNATYDQVGDAIKAGANHVTHLYNGMRGLHHREPGVVGAAYLRDELFVEVIADGIHSHPEMVKLAFNQITSDRMILITDSLRAKWLEKGIYDLGGQPVNVTETTATLSDGTLAGSILKMNEAIKNIRFYSDCSMKDIIKMTAENPAKQLNIFDRKGSIQVGKDADLVILNEQLDVEMTFCRGKLAFKKENV
jgi:N-acetylglucosamine-6-phosphate deacetylase